MFKAKFKTAYLQREIAESALIAADMTLGEMVVVTPATEHIPIIVKPLVAETEAAAKTEANAFLAQSDMTLDYGHVPVEVRDYRYSPVIKANVDLTDYGIGLFETVSDLPTDSTTVENDDEAYVYNSATETFIKYVASVADSTVTWATTDTVGVTLPGVKSVAYFNIMDVEDLVIYTIS